MQNLSSKLTIIASTLLLGLTFSGCSRNGVAVAQDSINHSAKSSRGTAALDSNRNVLTVKCNPGYDAGFIDQGNDRGAATCVDTVTDFHRFSSEALIQVFRLNGAEIVRRTNEGTGGHTVFFDRPITAE